jgi:hypothetical protein
MPIHPFDFNPKNIDSGVRPESIPVIPVQPQNQPNVNRVIAQTADPINTATDDVDNRLPIGYHTMDRGVKDFFSDIEVPTKDGTRKLDVRIAGGDKTILFWKQLMDADNRIKLPVMSINRTSIQPNTNKLTPASSAPNFYKRFADQDGTRMTISPREYSVLISYTISVWTERKRDMEYIVFQVMPRFNPIAEWRVQDEFMSGNIIGKLDSVTDNSDIDMEANQLAKVRYDFNLQIEGWLPLPGRIVPTVLGRVQDLAELDTREFFEVVKSRPRRFI